MEAFRLREGGLSAVASARVVPRTPPGAEPLDLISVRYRADIEGLRAVAVIPVVAFHIGMARIPGGYVGVDVFFVISGYLISSILLKDLSERRFSIVSFYERRVRRIAPALIVMLAATTGLACWYSLPEELTDYARSLVAAILSVSNFFFWQTSGYFDAPAAGKPLLHTWSLAVEEQFYLVLPVLLLLGFRYFRRWLTGVIWLAALLSLGLSAVGVFHTPDAAFYLPHSRAWELLLGTLLALRTVPPITGRAAREIAAGAGLAMILVAVLTFTAGLPFPGLAALVPCVGTALIIAAGMDGPSLTGRLLSLPPMVLVGRISYSLYLWHWPVILFQRLDSAFVPGSASREGKLVMVIVSVLLAAASWRWVERPFRADQKRVSRRTVFAAAFASAGMIVAGGSTLLALQGLPGRFPSQALAFSRYLDYGIRNFREGQCFLTQQNSIAAFDAATCLPQDGTRENDLILGDSLAAHLWFGFSTVFPQVNYQQATASGCKPTLEQPVGLFVGPCTRLMSEMFGAFLPRHPPAKLLISARWTADDLPRLAQTLRWARKRNIRVVLFGPMVQYDAALPRLLAFAVESNDASLPARHLVDQRPLDTAMAALSRQEGAAYVSLYDLLCEAQGCLEYSADQMPLQFDYGHLTGPGSVLVAKALLAAGALP